MLSRSPDLRATALGQGLAAQAGREMTRRLWRELGQLGEGAPLGSRVERIITGMMGSGYVALWAITDTSLLMLTERERASRALAHREITGVVLPARSVGVLAGGPDAVSLQSYGDVAGFGSALAARASVPLAGIDGLFSDAGYAVFEGAVTRVAGEHLGGIEGLAPAAVCVAFDDAGIHVSTSARPWWRVAAFPWPDVRELLVEGSEQTRRRVSLARVAALGPLAMALPDEEDASRAYLTIVTAAGDVILRFAGQTPQTLRVRLGDVLRRPAGSAPAAGLADELERIAGLHASGVLTDEEFAAAKRRLLGL